MRESGEIRKRNLRIIIDERFQGVAGRMCIAIGVKPPQLYRYLSDTAAKRQYPGEKFCRDIEAKLGLPRLWMDVAHDAPQEAGARIEPRSAMGVAGGAARREEDDVELLLQRVPAQRLVPLNARFVGAVEDGTFSREPAPAGSYIQARTLDQGAYAARVVGNASAPRIRHGEYVIVSPLARLQNGEDVVVVLTDERVLIKRLVADHGDAVELGSVNDSGKAMVVLRSAIRTVHAIVEHLPASTEVINKK